MRQPRLLRTLAMLLIATLVSGAFGSAIVGATPEGGASGRATDDEGLNNNPAMNNPMLTSDEVVQGSLRVSSPTDYEDWYRFGVGYDKVLNVSLQMVDYCQTEPWRINFQVVAYYNSGGTLYAFLIGNTENRWEHFYWLQIYTAGVFDVWLRVLVNVTQDTPPQVNSDPGNYTLSASAADPIGYSPGQTATGTIDIPGGPNSGYYYKVAAGTVPESKIFDVKLHCPVNGDYDLYVYNFWKYDPSNFWEQNGSYNNDSSGNTEWCRVGATEGVYYIEVRGYTGAGGFSLTSDVGTATPDDNNVPSKAMLVRDNNPHNEALDQGLDATDWWQVNLKAGKNLDEAYFSLSAPIRENNLYSMYIYDKDMNLRAQKYNTENGSMPSWDQTSPNRIINAISIKTIAATSDGPMYVCVRAMWHYYIAPDTINPRKPASGTYKMTFKLPNDPPALSGAIPEIHMDEDTTYDSLMISTFFSDPEGDKLSYMLLGSDYLGGKNTVTIDNQTGLVTLKPLRDWSGTNTVRFKVTDDGPGNRSVESNFTVVVAPVNDPPVLLEAIGDIQIAEDMLGTTPDLWTVFDDIDNLKGDLKFNLKIVSSETKPPGSNLVTLYDPAGHNFKLGPAHLFSGHFLIQVTCTDGVQSTVPVASTFNLTISHKNHKPTLRENIQDPMEMELKEHDKDTHLAMLDLFTDPDIPENYANDVLTFTVTGAQKLLVSINEDGYLVVDTGKEQYLPGVKYEEKLLITCKDKAGLKATLNITVTVIPVNDPPRIVTTNPQDTDLEMSENTRKMFSVTAVDDDTFNLTYNWYVNGKKDKNSKGLSFAFEPDSAMGGEVYTIRVDVFDGTTTINREWNVTVNEVNRLPAGVIKSPLNMTKFKKGSFVSFTAEGTDDDGDPLTFIWRDAAGVELGRGTTFTTDKLPKGVQTVTCEINDSKGASYQTVTVVMVVDSTGGGGGGIPGFEGVVVVAALGISIALAQLRRLRRRA